MRRAVVPAVVVLLGLGASPALAQDLPQAVTTQREMVVTANPTATAAGEQVLPMTPM